MSHRSRVQTPQGTSRMRKHVAVWQGEGDRHACEAWVGEEGQQRERPPSSKVRFQRCVGCGRSRSRSKRLKMRVVAGLRWGVPGRREVLAPQGVRFSF